MQSGTPGKPGTGRTSELPGRGVHFGVSLFSPASQSQLLPLAGRWDTGVPLTCWQSLGFPPSSTVHCSLMYRSPPWKGKQAQAQGVPTGSCVPQPSHCCSQACGWGPGLHMTLTSSLDTPHTPSFCGGSPGQRSEEEVPKEGLPWPCIPLLGSPQFQS